MTKYSFSFEVPAVDHDDIRRIVAAAQRKELLGRSQAKGLESESGWDLG
jgi:hypothetical protein